MEAVLQYSTLNWPGYMPVTCLEIQVNTSLLINAAELGVVAQACL
jgi:hypothetical protein